MSSRSADRREWLEADGRGGFASGTVSGVRTRRYHALLLAATTPPTGRFVLVNGFDAWVETPSGRYPITTQHYTPDVVFPSGAEHIDGFEPEPWPTWKLVLPDGTQLVQEIVAVHGAPIVVLRWRSAKPQAGVRLSLRPLLSGRDYHSLHHENPGFDFAAEQRGTRVTWRPYPGVPGIVSLSNGVYTHAPDWYRGFSYSAEQQRGLDFVEDLASPGTLTWDFSGGEAVWVLAAEIDGAANLPARATASSLASRLTKHEAKRRGAFTNRLERAADAYLVSRHDGLTVVAGYPWFTDWGRDTFIALRGLCLATGRIAEARKILMAWAACVSQGMLPNRFPDAGDTPEFNAVDASLWFVIAVHELLGTAAAAMPDQERQALQAAVEAILDGYARGTRYRIHADDDGLLAAGEAGVQLTWMDAKVGDWVVTPRIGKPVEVQALWLNALRIGAQRSERWAALLDKGMISFRERFWDPQRACLFDVVDVDHVRGQNDARLRPNQILAVGGLPFALLEGDAARQVVDVVEQQLLTPLGLRSLAASEPGYVAHYTGGVRERDGAYHQGTVWPWLLGPFVEAWVRVRGNSSAAKQEARSRFLEPLWKHLDDAGISHVSEVADAEAPFTPGGCPFQAWSVGEALRLDRRVLS